jgi:membrane associated rhomboid family serine protease
LNYQSNNYRPNTEFTVFPPAVKHLLIINLVVFIASWTPGIGPVLQTFAPLFPIESSQFYPWQFVSYMFMHAGLGHIIFNLFALWMFGQAIENFWGTKRFAIYYFLTGIGAGLLHVLINNDPVSTAQGLRYIPTVGASGAVYGILLAFGMMFPERPIMLLFLPIPIKAKYFVAFFGALELYNGVAGTQLGVANFAHLGGMLVGFILIKVWGLKKEERHHA